MKEETGRTLKNHLDKREHSKFIWKYIILSCSWNSSPLHSLILFVCINGFNSNQSIDNILPLTIIYVIDRFHNAAEEIVVGRDIVPPIDDNVQLTVDEYRSKLYEVPLVSVQFCN